MKISLVLCTYLRPDSLLRLLDSVKIQTRVPDEIVVIDGSENDKTEQALKKYGKPNLDYFRVDSEHRGLTRQRNFGISKVSPDSDIICFLDDDTILDPHYFDAVIDAFKKNENIVGVGGVAVNENRWERKKPGHAYPRSKYYAWEDYVVRESLRNRVRNYLGLQSHLPPGQMPNYSHGRTCSYPLTGEVYEVDLLIGMSFSFRKSIFDNIGFSSYFEGYGLYEDADFSIRAQKYGKLVIQTAAKLEHLHDYSGRPNAFRYGKMVVRNGWYVWRLKYPSVSIKSRFKWHAITVLLAWIRFLNTITGPARYQALNDALGRFTGWFILLFKKPHILR